MKSQEIDFWEDEEKRWAQLGTAKRVDHDYADSSMVEPRSPKPMAAGSNPASASKE